MALLTFCGLSAIGYTVASAAFASSEPPMPSVEEVVAAVQTLPDALPHDGSEPAKELPQPVRRAEQTAATNAASKPSTGPASQPQPPPSAAQPVTRIKGARPNPPRQAANAPVAANDAFSVAVVIDPSSSIELFGLEVVKRLTERGLQAKLVTLDDAGRPDALLVLGRSTEKKPATWFCDPGPQGGSTLSRLLLDSLAALPLDGAGSEPPAASRGPVTEFPCADIGAGRARVAATLLEVPNGIVARDELRASAGDQVVTALTRYFGENGSSVRAARAATRFVWPAAGPISSYFGRNHPLGIDVAQMQGNIVAATAGTVVFAGGNPCCSYGLYVVVDSPDGVRTLYGHLSTLAVTRGQKVRQGQTLGKVGNTGVSTGTHLHFEVIDRGVRVDPLRYLP